MKFLKVYPRDRGPDSESLELVSPSVGEAEVGGGRFSPTRRERPAAAASGVPAAS